MLKKLDRLQLFNMGNISNQSHTFYALGKARLQNKVTRLCEFSKKNMLLAASEKDDVDITNVWLYRPVLTVLIGNSWYRQSTYVLKIHVKTLEKNALHFLSDTHIIEKSNTWYI